MNNETNKMRNQNIITKAIYLPEYSENLAEFIGILLGDGNLQFYNKSSHVRYYAIRISGHADADKQYLLEYVNNLIYSLFKEKASIYRHKNEREITISLHSKTLIEYLQKIGITPGNKIVTQVTIPDWIKTERRFLSACLRGLIDTDGSVFRMSKRDSKYARISFTNNNATLLNDCREAFILLGFNPSKIFTNQFFISRQKEIEKYIKEVGFSNPKHLNRLSAILAP